jgi:predicted metalloprotease with PDZ domain
VQDFVVTGDGKPLDWDKLDFDTWRIEPDGAKEIVVSFDYRADSLDNAMAQARDDFAFFNGTNIFLYPEGRGTDFAANVTVKTESNWLVATGMTSTGARAYTASSFHDLVDFPFFVGRFDLDSAQIAGKWVRLATYPAGFLSGEPRKELWDQMQRFFPPQIAVTGETPFETYTVLQVYDSTSSSATRCCRPSRRTRCFTRGT